MKKNFPLLSSAHTRVTKCSGPPRSVHLHLHLHVHPPWLTVQVADATLTNIKSDGVTHMPKRGERNEQHSVVIPSATGGGGGGGGAGGAPGTS